MKLAQQKSLDKSLRVQKLAIICLAIIGLFGAALPARSQAPSTTTVTGTVYLANGQPGSGTLVLKWPSFTTAAGQLIAADSATIQIPADGFVSINLAPNLGATPAGQYYTAIYYMSDGSTSTQYWVVPAAAQAALAQVQAQVMPAAQAVQTVSKSYVDQSIAELAGSELTSSGGNLSGPLYLNGDPTQALQAADKHYVDEQVATAVPLTGGTLTGPLTATKLGAAYQVDQFPGADFGARLQACLSAVNASYGGTCDARNFTGTQSMVSNLTISTGNTIILLPCATIATASQLIVTAGTRNVSLRGCALRGGSAASGSMGGTVFAYSGTAAMIQVGDPTYAADTPGFHLDNAVINTTAATGATAQALIAYRVQELDLESLYFLGNSNQTGMTLDGTGNYTGGTFLDNQFDGFGTAIDAIGHQAANPATTDWVNASTFVRLHIDCPTSSGNPIAGTYGINLQQGDGNTFTGGDVEGCATALHLGVNAQNNTIVGLRNENSTSQVVADAGSSYNNWITGGTIFTGKLTDNGTRNSFLDTFHRSFNELNGDWYGSQQNATVTNHYRLGIGAGNERGLLNEYQTDSGYRWTLGLSDATAGEQYYQILDQLNNVYRFQIGQYNSGQSSTNNQTVINAAGSGAVVLNGSSNSGTGGVVFGSGGASGSTVATISNTGNAQFNGTLQVGGTAQSAGTMTVRNNADAEVDYYLWPGLTTSQKGSFTYKDWNGNSQWYMLKDASNNWALNSAVGGLDSFKAYQSTNSGDTYIDASNATGHIRLNYETGSGAETDIYSGSSANLVAAFLAPSSIKFPGLAASSGTNCLQIDNSGYITNTGAACGSGSGVNGMVNSGTAGQIAYYNANGTAIAGTSTVIAQGGLQDALSYFPYNSWACGRSGADESVKIDNCITADASASVIGRKYVSSANGVVTWSQNPFAPLTVSSGSLPGVGSFELDLPPTQTITAKAEIDPGYGTTLDCGTGYGAYASGLGTTILPASSGFPSTVLMTDGPASTSTTTPVSQGVKIRNCTFDTGVSGMTALDLSWGQEGTKVTNNRLTGFMICFNRDALATDGGFFHNWGIYDNQCEMSDAADPTVWGARYSYNVQGGESGILENFSAIGGANSTGNTKIAVENDGSGLQVRNATFESLAYGIVNNNVHSSFKYANEYREVGGSSADAAMSILGLDAAAGPDDGSDWEDFCGPEINLKQLNQPSATVRSLHTDPCLGFYRYNGLGNTAQGTVLTTDPQAANSNLKFGDSYENAAAWPAIDLPAKTVTLTIGGNTFMGDQYMTAADVSAQILPEGLASNGDLASATASVAHSMALVRHGPGNCIFDGATTANDYVVPSSNVWNGTGAVMCHDSGSAAPPASGPYIGKVQKTVSVVPATPAAPTVTTNCSGTCATTYSYAWVQMANNDPTDHTQSAASSAGTVLGAAALTSTVTNSISGCATAASLSPCRLYEIAGPHPGFLEEVISTAAVTDNGMIGDGSTPYPVGVIDPPVHVELGQTGAAIAASNSPGIVRPDNVTITVNASGVLSAPGNTLSRYWNSEGSSSSTPFATTANTQYAQEYPITAQVNFAKMCVYVNTADSSTSDYYGLALVKLAAPTCTGSGCATVTVAHWQGENLTSTGAACFPNAEGSVTVMPGNYYLVTTGNASTAQYSTTNSAAKQFSSLSSASAGTSSSGDFGTITLSVATSGLNVISGAGGPIWAGLSQ